MSLLDKDESGGLFGIGACARAVCVRVCGTISKENSIFVTFLPYLFVFLATLGVPVVA